MRLNFRRLFPILVLVALAGFAGAKTRPPAEVRVCLVQTTDVHGRILPWDYFQDRETSLGLAKVATKVKELRQANPNLILIDNGDMIQGTPLSYYFALERTDLPHPLMAVMNAMGYAAMTIGNHEYNYGLEVLERCRREARFPFLSANTYRQGAEDQPYFKPYVIQEFGGVRIGILGLTTSNVPNWELPANYGDLVFRDTLSEARKWVRILREQERVDAVVLSTHEGYEVDIQTGQPNGSSHENMAWAIIHQVPGVDVVLTGHSHENVPPQLVNGVLTAQANRWADHVAVLNLVFRKSGKTWQLAEKTGENVALAASIAPDPEIMELAKPYHEQTLAWLNREIGTLTAEMSTQTVFSEDNALLDLVHEVMRAHTGAELSFTSYLPGRPLTFRQGPLKVRDIYSIYIYENSIVKLAIKGSGIRAALERTAMIYDQAGWNADKGRFEIQGAKEFRSYNFSTLAGADYAIDPTRPVGQRVLYLNVDGRPIDPEREYTLAVSNYQAVGGGQYQMFKEARWISNDPRDIRSLIVEYIDRQETLPPACAQNWHLQFPCQFQPYRRPAPPAPAPAN